MWVDFITLVLVSIYLYYYRNPVLSTHAESFLWCKECKIIGNDSICSCIEQNSSVTAQTPGNNVFNDTDEVKLIEFCKNLDEYHKLMVLKYPSETEYKNNRERLRELLDSCPYYLIVEGA